MRVKLTLNKGASESASFEYTQPDTLLFGTASDMHVRIENDELTSRRHFSLLIAERECRVRDLSSRNGTYVGREGKFLRYGGRAPLPPGAVAAPSGAIESVLHDGDTINAGKTSIFVRIELPAETVLQSDAPQSTAAAQGQPDSSNTSPQKELSTASAPLVFPGYVLLEKIGEGGMGVVFKALQTATGRTVAIKTLAPSTAANAQQQMQAFLRGDVEQHGTLKHPHIVEQLDVVRAGPVLGVVLEYVKGVTLARYVHQCGGSLTLDEAIPLMLGALAGLAHVHVSGIVHRDLKPENIFLATDGAQWSAKVADFGLAKRYDSTGKSLFDVAGTPSYWPREHLTSYRSLCPPSDVFSIAAVFYWVLTGCHAREGMSEMLARHAANGTSPGFGDYSQVISGGKVVPIGRRLPSLPGSVCEVFDYALKEELLPREIQNDPDALREKLARTRYPNAGAFKDALSLALSRHRKRQSAHPTVLLDLEPRLAQWTAHAQRTRPDAPCESEIAGSFTMIEAQTDREAALFVLDLESSTEMLLREGDSYFSGLVHRLFRLLTTHARAGNIVFLSCTGDGFFTAFDSVDAAYEVAQSFFAIPDYPDHPTRMALHWGKVKDGPGGNPLGVEMHRCFRMEGVKAADCVAHASAQSLPPSRRIVASPAFLERLNAKNRERFVCVGEFKLKGFSEPCELFVAKS